MFKQIIAGLFGTKEAPQTQPAAPVAVALEPAQPPINIDQAIDQLRSLIHHPEVDRISSLRLCITFCESVFEVQMITKRIEWPANRWSTEMQDIYNTALDSMCMKQFDIDFNDTAYEHRIERLFWIARQSASTSGQLEKRAETELLREIRSSKTVKAAIDLIGVCKLVNDKFGLDAQYGRIAELHARGLFRKELSEAETTDTVLELRKHAYSFSGPEHRLATERAAQTCTTIQQVTHLRKTVSGETYGLFEVRAVELCSSLEEVHEILSAKYFVGMEMGIESKWDELATSAVERASETKQLEDVFLLCRPNSKPALQAIEKMALIPR